MILKIPEDILSGAGLTEKDCLIELAVHLYSERKIAPSQALRLGNLSRAAFESELAKRNISLYTLDDLHQDVAALKEIGNL